MKFLFFICSLMMAAFSCHAASPFGDVHGFLDRLFENIEEAGVDVSAYEMDHICYMAETVEEYIEMKAEFAQVGERLREAIVSGRPFVVYKLHEPITYRGRELSIIEMPAPKVGKKPKSGLEHVEFVTDEDFSVIVARYPHLTFDTSSAYRAVNPELTLRFDDGTLIRFHHEPLEKVVLDQRENPRDPGLVEKARISVPSLLSASRMEQLQELKEIPEGSYQNRKEVGYGVIYEMIAADAGLGFGMSLIDINGESASHYHVDTIEIVVGINGTTEVAISDEIYIVRSGDALMLPVGAPHRIKNVGDHPSRVLMLSYFNKVL